MPIKSWDDSPVILPRLGEIKLGERLDNGALRAFDHFVVPPEVEEKYGPNPTVIPIMFPSEDIDVIIPHWCDRYVGGSVTTPGRLVCRGNEVVAQVELGQAIKDRDRYGLKLSGQNKLCDKNGVELSIQSFGNSQWATIPCGPKCPFLEVGGKVTPTCRKTFSLNFLLPEIPGLLGVYTLNSSSIHSFKNIQAALQMLKQFTGGVISYVELQLVVKPRSIAYTAPDGSRGRRIQPILSLNHKLSFAQLMEWGQNRRAMMQIQPLAKVSIEDEGMERLAPDTLYSEAVVEEVEENIQVPTTPPPGPPTEVRVESVTRTPYSEGDEYHDDIAEGVETAEEPAKEEPIENEDGGAAEEPPVDDVAGEPKAEEKTAEEPKKPETSENAARKSKGQRKSQKETRVQVDKIDIGPISALAKELSIPEDGLRELGVLTFENRWNGSIEDTIQTKEDLEVFLERMKSFANIGAQESKESEEAKPEPEEEENGVPETPTPGVLAQNSKVRFRVISMPNPVVSGSGLKFIIVSTKIDGQEGLWEITTEDKPSCPELRANRYYYATIRKVKPDQKKVLVVDVTAETK